MPETDLPQGDCFSRGLIEALREAEAAFEIFEESSEPAAIERAVLLSRAVLRALNRSGEAGSLRNEALGLYGLALSRRFTRRGYLLDARVSARICATALSEIEHAPDQASALRAALVAMRRAVAVVRQSTALLDETISLADAFVEGARVEPRSPRFIEQISQRALCQRERFVLSGRREDIENALADWARALSAMGEENPRRYRLLANAATGARLAGVALRNPELLEEAAQLGAIALDAAPDAHSDVILTNLANAYASKFELSGDIVDLDIAIAHAEDAYALTPVDDSDWPNLAATLASLIAKRRARGGPLPDAERAKALLVAAISSSAPPSSKAIYFNSLGNVLRDLADDLDPSGEGAIAAHETAASLLPLEHHHRAAFLANAASAALSKAAQLQDGAAARKAVSVARTAAFAAGGVDPAARWSGLYAAYKLLHDMEPERAPLLRALLSARNAFRLSGSDRARSLYLAQYADALRHLGHRSSSRPLLESALSLLGHALDLRPSSPTEAPDALPHIALFEDWADSAVHLAYELDALEQIPLWLERGRTNWLAGQLAYFAAPPPGLALEERQTFLDLQARLRRGASKRRAMRARLVASDADHPKIEQALAALATEARSDESALAHLGAHVKTSAYQTQDLARIADALQAVIVHIGFNKTLGLVAAATSSSGVRFFHEPALPRSVFYEDLFGDLSEGAAPQDAPFVRDRSAARLQHGLERMVSRLTPLGDFLATQAKQAPQARLLLIPGDVLSLAPFPAIPLSDGTCLLDTAVVSIAPSARLAAHAFARAEELGPRDAQRFTSAVALVNPDGTLPLADIDADALRGALSEAVTLASGPRATLRFLTDEAHKSDIVHLSAHARADLLNAQSTMLQLAPDSMSGAHKRDDGRVSLETLLGGALVLKPGALVFMAACESGLAQSARAPSEQIGFPAVALFAGARTFLGAYWSVSDAFAALFVQRFYNALQKSMAPAEAARASMLALRDMDRASVLTALDSLAGPDAPFAAQLAVSRARAKVLQGPDKPYKASTAWAAFGIFGPF